MELSALIMMVVMIITIKTERMSLLIMHPEKHPEKQTQKNRHRKTDTEKQTGRYA
jgi:hypothetical protein